MVFSGEKRFCICFKQTHYHSIPIDSTLVPLPLEERPVSDTGQLGGCSIDPTSKLKTVESTRTKNTRALSCAARLHVLDFHLA